MRNPFARLAKRDAPRPSLRERAAFLKASASRVIRRKLVDAAPATPSAALNADPILAAIAETRRLARIRSLALDVDLPPGTIDPTPEQNAAADAFLPHFDGVLLKTVPTTAAGCAALARFAGDFLEDEGFCLDENASNDQHVRILGLIARSPMLDGAPPVPPLVPDFTGYRSRRPLRGGLLMRVVPSIPQAVLVPSLLRLARIGFETWRLRRIAAGLARANAWGDADAARRWLARVDGALADLDRAQDRLRPRRRSSRISVS